MINNGNNNVKSINVITVTRNTGMDTYKKMTTEVSSNQYKAVYLTFFRSKKKPHCKQIFNYIEMHNCIIGTIVSKFPDNSLKTSKNLAKFLVMFQHPFSRAETIQIVLLFSRFKIFYWPNLEISLYLV